jgi:hypothetical protein
VRRSVISHPPAFVPGEAATVRAELDEGQPALTFESVHLGQRVPVVKPHRAIGGIHRKPPRARHDAPLASPPRQPQKSGLGGRRCNDPGSRVGPGLGVGRLRRQTPNPQLVSGVGGAEFLAVGTEPELVRHAAVAGRQPKQRPVIGQVADVEVARGIVRGVAAQGGVERHGLIAQIQCPPVP